MPRRRTNPGNTQQMIGVCRMCGEYYSTAESDIANVCPSCVETNYFSCPECGHQTEASAGIDTSSGRTLCPVCAPSVGFRCSCCEETHERASHSHIVDHDGNIVCDQCWDDYYRCVVCRDYFHIDDLQEQDDEDYHCWHCASQSSHGAIRSYSYKPAPVFHRAEGEPGDSLVLGIELEMDEGDAEAAVERITNLFGEDWLYFKHDGSLDDGAELVTHPISPAVLLSEEGRQMWRDICESALAEDMRSHDADTCGLHIHVNRDYFGSSATARIMAEYKLTALCDRLFEPLALFSRRKRSQLERWAKRPHVPISDGGWMARARATHSCSCGDRYRAVNVRNEHTIEFRMFRGTLKPATLFATFAFVAGLCAYAKDATPTQVERITWYDLCDEVLRCCPAGARKLREYLAEKELITIGA